MRAAFGPDLCTSMGPAEVARLKAKGFGAPVAAIGANCAQVPIYHRGVRIVDRRFVDTATRSGFPVHVWTVDDRDVMEGLIDVGVRGIMTDRPALLKRVLQERGLW